MQAQDKSSFLRYDFRQRRTFTFPRMEYLMCATFLFPDLDAQCTCRLCDFIKAQLIRPVAACLEAGNVIDVANVNVVIEWLQSDIKYTGSSTVPIPVGGAGGSAIG
jgi:hypothetical protein